MLSKVGEVNAGWVLFSAVIIHSFTHSCGPRRMGVRPFSLRFFGHPSTQGATAPLTSGAASLCFNLPTDAKYEWKHTVSFSECCRYITYLPPIESKTLRFLILKQSTTKSPQDGKKKKERKKGFHCNICLFLWSKGTMPLVALGETRPRQVPQASQLNSSSALLCWSP